MKRYKYMSLALFTAVLLSIVVFHSGMNLKERVAPPSEMWGRHIPLGVTDYKKAPAIYTEGARTTAIFADEKGFQRVEMDSKGYITDKGRVDIKGYVPARLVKYQRGGNRLFWTENYDLFCTDLIEGALAKNMLLPGILDFQLIDTGNEITIVTAAKNSISVYSFSENGILKPLADYPVNDAAYVSAIRDNNGSLYIAGVSRISPTEYKLRLMSYDPQTGNLSERVEPVTIENFTTTREGSNSINNLELGFDEKDIYVFYEIGKYSSQGMVARTYMGRIPKNSQGIEKLDFERFKLDAEGKDEENYIASLRCLRDGSDKLSMVLTTPVRTSIRRQGTELVFVMMDEGKVKYKSVATNTGQWNSFASLSKLDGQYAAAFLQTLGGTQYTVNLTLTTEEYKANLNRTTFDDIKSSVMDTVGAYVFSFFAIFINLLTVSFLLLWPICVDFFEWKFFFRNPLITFRIGVAMETFMMYFSIRRIYVNKEINAVAFMPEILKHGISPVVILLLTAGIAYAIVHLYRKSKTDLHSFPELALFILVHNIFVYFIYTAYIARF